MPLEPFMLPMNLWANKNGHRFKVHISSLTQQEAEEYWQSMRDIWLKHVEGSKRRPESGKEQ